jgi:hypothetical protein
VPPRHDPPVLDRVGIFADQAKLELIFDRFRHPESALRSSASTLLPDASAALIEEAQTV